MDGSRAVTIPYLSSYLQYKHNTSILIRWVVTKASALVPEPSVSKPKNNNPKHKKRIARAARAALDNISNPEVTLSGLVSLSEIIADAEEPLPDTISRLFDSVIKARTAAYECFEKLWADNPDEDLKQSNESHKAFIDALGHAWDLLGGAAWRDRKANRGSDPKKPKSNGISELPKAEIPESVEFLNRFDKLDIDDLPSEDEAELDELVSKPADLEEPIGIPLLPGKGKSKGKRRKGVVAEPLEKYKIKSDIEVYFAVCFFVRDFLELRRYTFKLWQDVGHGRVHCATAGALSNLAVEMVKVAQYDLAMDYPDSRHYRGVINHVIRNVDVNILGDAKAAPKSKSSALVQTRKIMREAEEGLMLNTHDDLVTFITEYRKKRNGRPGPSVKSINWNPNFISTQNERSLVTPERMRKWKADYAISWLWDLVNSYAASRIDGLSNSNTLENAENLDWDYIPLKSVWTTRPLWGPLEFARDITKLAFQKPESAIAQEIKPHHVFQLQIAIDSMITAKRWVATPHTPPIDCFGQTYSTLAWDYSNDQREVKAISDRWSATSIGLVELFKEDALRQGDEGLWSAPIKYLEIFRFESLMCGESLIGVPDKRPSDMKLPASMFNKSTDAGLWLYSPYLCGTGEAEFLHMAYDWGTKCWDRSGFVVGFFHLYNMLLECKHISKPIKAFERTIEVFKSDIFRGDRRPKAGGERDQWNFVDAFSAGIGTKTEFFANPVSRRRAKGGGFATDQSHFRRGNKNEHTLFKGASKLYALGQADYKKDRLDTRSFPSLTTVPRTAVEFLDAVKADVETDFKGKSPVALLNYNGILTVIMLILQAIDEEVSQLPVVKKRMAQEFAEHNKLEFGLHDKVFSLAFGSADVMMQDARGERMDNAILRKMGYVIEKVWTEIEAEILPVFLLNDVPEKQLVKKGAPRNLVEDKETRKILEEKLAGIKEIDPATYREVMAMVQSMQVGDCANCPDCQAGVKLEGDLVGKVEDKLRGQQKKKKRG